MTIWVYIVYFLPIMSAYFAYGWKGVFWVGIAFSVIVTLLTGIVFYNRKGSKNK